MTTTKAEYQAAIRQAEQVFDASSISAEEAFETLMFSAQENRNHMIEAARKAHGLAPRRHVPEPVGDFEHLVHVPHGERAGRNGART